MLRVRHGRYDHFVFDAPKLFDLSSLYSGGDANAAVVGEIVAHVFELQPKCVVALCLACFRACACAGAVFARGPTHIAAS